MENKNENTYTLSKPFSFEGETYTELNLNFDDLTGEDLLSVERQINASGQPDFSPVKELSKSYLAVVVAKAAKVPVELIYKLSAKDFSKVTVRAQNFLLG